MTEKDLGAAAARCNWPGCETPVPVAGGWEVPIAGGPQTDTRWFCADHLEQAKRGGISIPIP